MWCMPELDEQRRRTSELDEQRHLVKLERLRHAEASEKVCDAGGNEAATACRGGRGRCRT